MTEKRTGFKNEICKTAMKLFSEKGFDQVSVNAICREVGITKPTFYKYVDSKEDILKYYYGMLPDHLPENWDTVSDGNYWNAVERGLLIYFDHYTALGSDLLSDIISAQITRRALVFQTSSTWYTSMLRLLEQGQKAGQIGNQTPPKRLMSLLTAFAIGFCFYYCTDVESCDKKEVFIENLKAICRIQPEASALPKGGPDYEIRPEI